MKMKKRMKKKQNSPNKNGKIMNKFDLIKLTKHYRNIHHKIDFDDRQTML